MLGVMMNSPHRRKLAALLGLLLVAGVVVAIAL